MANIKISELTPKGANLATTDLLEISESAGGGAYVTKSITGAEIRAGLQSTLTLTTTGTSGAATLVGSTLNIPQYSGGAANPSVIAANYADGTIVTGTTTNTISQSLLIPANSFTGNGMLEVLARVTKTGSLGTLTARIYVNTTNSITGATLIGTIVGSTSLWAQGIRTMRINSNTLTCIASSSSFQNDNTSSTFTATSATFTTSVDNYIIFSIQLANAGDSARFEMSRAVRYI